MKEDRRERALRSFYDIFLDFVNDMYYNHIKE